MFDFTAHFTVLWSDIALEQEFIFVVTHTNDYLYKSGPKIQGYELDRFVLSYIRSHKVTSVIWLSKVFEDSETVHSIHRLTRWLHENESEFTQAKVIQRKITAGMTERAAIEYAKDIRDVAPEDFKALYKMKRKLSNDFQKQVKPLRNNYYAHSAIEPETNSDSVYIAHLTHLADGAKGIYDDIFGAFYNGKPFMLVKRPFIDRDGIAKQIESYFEKYRISD